MNRCGSDPFLEYDGASLIIDPQGNHLTKANSEEAVIYATPEINIVQDWGDDFPALKDSKSKWWEP